MLIFKNLQTAVNIRASLASVIKSSLIFLWYCTKVNEPLVLLVNPLEMNQLLICTDGHGNPTNQNKIVSNIIPNPYMLYRTVFKL